MWLKNLAKSPLRYPGGKSPTISQILPQVPLNIREYRESFVGSGSVFLAVRSLFKKHIKYVINDLIYDVYCFWNYARQDIKLLSDGVLNFREYYQHRGRDLYQF